MNYEYFRNTYKKIAEEDFKGLSDWLNTLDPYEFTLSGLIIAFLISIPLNANQQNSVGNYLEAIGQTLLTIAAQEITVNQATFGNNTNQGDFDKQDRSNDTTVSNNSNAYNSEIEYLKREIANLRNELNKRR